MEPRACCPLRTLILLLLCAVAKPCSSMRDYSCSACPAGKYKTQNTDIIPDPHPCFSCLGKGEWSAEGAEHCSCNAGYSGIAGGKTYGTCKVCSAGQFKSDVSDNLCQMCSLSTCPVGYYLSDCVPAQDHTCTPCTNVPGANLEYVATALPGSHTCDVGCKAGWTNITVGNITCSLCPAGTYKASLGSGQCTTCPLGTFSLGGAAHCTSCRTTCPRGFVIANAATTCGVGATQDIQCIICPMNTYKDTGAVCKSCDVNAISLNGSSASSNCKCNAGYTIIDSFDGIEYTRRCEMCSPNTFSSAGEDYCSACDANAQSAIGSHIAIDCKCNAGFTGENGGTCRACVSGKFKALPAGPSQCQSCRDIASDGLQLATSLPASTSETACTCPQGFRKQTWNVCADVDECSDSDLNTCPTSSLCINTVGSFTCVCAEGHTGDAGAGDTCQQCPPNTYKDSKGKGTCTSCPAFSSSLIASTSSIACTCNAGYYGPRGGPCAA